MTMQSKFRRIAVAAASALTLTLGVGIAGAQPAGGPHAFAFAGPHGPAAGGEMIGHLIERVKTQLNLNTSQQQMFDAAATEAKSAREAARTRHQQVRDAMQAQLAKTEPDLAAVALVADDVEQQNRAARIKVRNQWLALYNTFTVEQKAVVRDLLQQRVARAEAFRQKMRERIQQRSSGANG